MDVAVSLKGQALANQMSRYRFKIIFEQSLS